MNQPIAPRPRLEYRGQILYITLETFAANGNTCLCLTTVDGEPYARCSVNLDVPLPEYRTFIKDYAENAGVAQAFVNAGYLRATGRAQHSGFVDIMEYEITQKLGDLLGLTAPASQDEIITRLGGDELSLAPGHQVQPSTPAPAPKPKRKAPPKKRAAKAKK